MRVERNLEGNARKRITLLRGAFSVVKEGKEIATGKKCALKCISKKHMKVHLLKREIEIMKKIQHPNVLSMIDIFEDKDHTFLVLDLVTGGELFQKIIDRGHYTEEDTRKIIHQVLDAVNYLHDKGVAHRDLKPENILCSDDESNLHIWVADFGLSKLGDEAMETQCGSLEYTAPEVLNGTPYDKTCDLWSIGVITFVLLTGCFPFFTDDGNVAKLYNKIQSVDFNWVDCPESVSAAAKHFITHLLVKDVANRLTASQALKHPWIMNKGVSNLSLRTSFANLLVVGKKK